MRIAGEPSYWHSTASVPYWDVFHSGRQSSDAKPFRFTPAGRSQTYSVPQPMPFQANSAVGEGHVSLPWFRLFFGLSAFVFSPSISRVLNLCGEHCPDRLQGDSWGVAAVYEACGRSWPFGRFRECGARPKVTFDGRRSATLVGNHAIMAPKRVRAGSGTDASSPRTGLPCRVSPASRGWRNPIVDGGEFVRLARLGFKPVDDNIQRTGAHIAVGVGTGINPA